MTRETQAHRRERLKARAQAVTAEAKRQYEAFSEGGPDMATWGQLSRECADTWRASAVESLGHAR